MSFELRITEVHGNAGLNPQRLESREAMHWIDQSDNANVLADRLQRLDMAGHHAA